jgi:hypothetical protein
MGDDLTRLQRTQNAVPGQPRQLIRRGRTNGRMRRQTLDDIVFGCVFHRPSILTNPWTLKKPRNFFRHKVPDREHLSDKRQIDIYPS